MPELPEAESIVRALARVLAGRRIVKVETFAPHLRSDLGPLVRAKLSGRTVIGCRRRGRYAVIDLDDGRSVVMHFGMSGVVRVEDSALPRRRHEHVFIHLDDGRAVRFEDPRRFGAVEVHRLGGDGWPEPLREIGVEPLTAAFSGAYLFRASRGRKKTVKEFIMDNRIVTGIGNIYAAETLFACGISPTRPASALDEKECAAIVREAKRILREAIRLGGTTVSDYRNVDGSEGKFVQKLKIYAKKNCPVCGGDVSKVTLGSRTSWFCPECQR